MVRKILLGCGIVSSVLYVVSDVLGTLRYEGYSYADQEFSELTAQGSPVRPLMIALNVIPYTLLMVAFAMGVWTSADRKHARRITGGMLLGYAAFGMAGGLFFPMKPREALAAGEGTLRNAMHIPATVVMSLFILLAMGFGAMLLGKRFRYYSYATIAILIVCGVLTSLQVGKMVANQPTPLMGLTERINIYATMLWVAVLAIGLLRAQKPR
jgi:drug/metabolite transporter (DMT)-like permease